MPPETSTINSKTIPFRPTGITLDSFDDIDVADPFGILSISAGTGVYTLARTNVQPLYGGIAVQDATTILASSQPSRSVGQASLFGGPLAAASGTLAGINLPTGLLVTEPLGTGGLTTSIATPIAGVPYPSTPSRSAALRR